MAGGVLVLSTKPRPSFDPCQVLRTLSVETLFATNALVVVPTMLYNLEQFLKQGNRSCVFDSVRLILIGGQSISKDGLAFVRRVFPNARIVQTFACTEAASSLTFLDINDSARNSPPIPGNLAGDCVGYSPPHVRLGLYDNNVTIVAPYHLGQISFQGPCTMNGYWNRQGSYSSSLDETHWFISNDLGFWDATGCLYFAGRTTDSIRTGGETVMASEVERVLVQHPDIEEVAVFALRDARYGETVCCAIVSNVPAAPELGDVRGWCKAHGLAGFKRPTRVFRLKNLPKNASGKVLKYRLVECFSAKEFPSKL
jgi:fatty-acyl-CoA synthase